MKKESLEKGNRLQEKLFMVKERIDDLNTTEKISSIQIRINKGNPKDVVIVVENKSEYYTDKTNTNLEYLNHLYRDNVLRSLERCKKELDREFELLGNEDGPHEEED